MMMCNSLLFFSLLTFFKKKQVAELMVTRCIREAVLLAWVVLWVLSTRVGTLLLCGRLSLSFSGGARDFSFPCVSRFADMPVARREAALQRWNSTRWLLPLRIVFTLVKILSHYVFYAMVRSCKISCSLYLVQFCMNLTYAVVP